ncbi:hypothetical protein QOZ80_4BG0330500 [Eleusine coracana subsp. coracana]|nr:hypothetical protein QOZ80_4BG0330500 [Eleusine coracana subsp. coracana]
MMAQFNGGSRGCDTPVPEEIRESPGEGVDLDCTEWKSDDEKADSWGVTSRCAVRQVFQVVSCFDSRKKQLVRSVGFGGLLEFPPLASVNRRFSVWLMSRVEVTDQSIVIEDGKRLPFLKEDIGLVFGIPSAGMNVFGRDPQRIDGKKYKIPMCLGLEPKECRSVKAVQEILEMDYGPEMSAVEESAFRVAFVVFVMSTLLALSTKHDYVMVDYWKALVDPSRIGDYDWSAFVMEQLMEGVVKLRSDMKKKVGVNNISGCSLFLQVLYLDSIDLGVWNIDHGDKPRIRFFNTERMKNMINAASARWDRGPNRSTDIATDLRPAELVCYGWAKGASRIRCFQGIDGQLWQTVTSVAEELKVPSEAAGKLYFAVANYDRKVYDFMKAEGNKLVKNLASIISPYASHWTVPSASSSTKGYAHTRDMYKQTGTDDGRELGGISKELNYAHPGASCSGHWASKSRKRKASLDLNIGLAGDGDD